MMNLPSISGEFRTSEDPQLRFTPNGMGVCEVRAVATRRKNVDGNWVDDKTCWVKVVGWREMAEHMAETLTKGMLIAVVGDLETDQWEDSDGNKRVAVVLHARTIGPSLSLDTYAKTSDQHPKQEGGQQPRPEPSAGGGDEPPF